MPLAADGSIRPRPFKPGVYQGDGTEKRVNIQFQIDEAQRAAVEAIEERVREQLEIPVSAWNSSSKPKGPSSERK